MYVAIHVEKYGNYVPYDENGILINISQVSNVQCVIRQSRRLIIWCVRRIITNDYLDTFIHDYCICISDRRGRNGYFL